MTLFCSKSTLSKFWLPIKQVNTQTTFLPCQDSFFLTCPFYHHQQPSQTTLSPAAAVWSAQEGPPDLQNPCTRAGLCPAAVGAHGEGGPAQATLSSSPAPSQESSALHGDRAAGQPNCSGSPHSWLLPPAIFPRGPAAPSGFTWLNQTWMPFWKICKLFFSWTKVFWLNTGVTKWSLMMCYTGQTTWPNGTFWL